MKPTLPVRRNYDPKAPNYVRVAKDGVAYGLKLTGDPEFDKLLREVSSAAEGYGVGGHAPSVVIRKAKT